MESARSLTFGVCLVLSALPATAGPLSRAITREAVRLAAAGEPTSSGVETVHQSDNPAQSDWSRVRKLAPGTEVVVTIRGRQPGTRHVVVADESELTVLNLADATVPEEAARVLLDLASTHSEYLAGAKRGGTFVIGNVRLEPDGVFVADRKIAGFAQIVEQINRTDIGEIMRPPATVGASAAKKRVLIWTAAGAVTGFLFGLAYGSGACDGGAGCERNVALSISGAGAGIGAVIGALSRRNARDVIYRVP